MSMETIAEKISSLPADQLNDVVQALVARYAVLFPEYDVTFLSLPRHNPPLRRRQLEQMLPLLMKECPE